MRDFYTQQVQPPVATASAALRQLSTYLSGVGNGFLQRKLQADAFSLGFQSERMEKSNDPAKLAAAVTQLRTSLQPLLHANASFPEPAIAAAKVAERHLAVLDAQLASFGKDVAAPLVERHSVHDDSDRS